MSQRLVLKERCLVADLRRALPLEDLSRMELRDRLVVAGWHIADEAHLADVAERRLQRHGTRAYFTCLLHPMIASVPALSHSAQCGYYLAHIAMLDGGGELTHIPVSRRAPWFEELLDFFAGRGPDPRLAILGSARPLAIEDGEDSARPLAVSDAAEAPAIRPTPRPKAKSRVQLPRVLPVLNSPARDRSRSPRRSASRGSSHRSHRRRSSSSSSSSSSRSSSSSNASGGGNSGGPEAHAAYAIQQKADWSRKPDLLRLGAMEGVMPHLHRTVNVVLKGSPFDAQVRHCLDNLPQDLQNWGPGCAYSSKCRFGNAIVTHYEVVPTAAM